MKKIILLIAIIAIAWSNEKTIFSEPGYGPSTKPFKDPAWQLPSGVQLADSIHEYSYCWAFPPYTQVKQKDWRGVPVGFPFCISLRNTGSQPIIIQFPPELVLVSSSPKHQNTVIIDWGMVEVRAGVTKTIVAQGFCLNKGRTPPSTFEDDTENLLGYSFGPSKVLPALKEVLDIVESEHITMNDILKPDGTIDNTKITNYATIQSAIWEVTDEKGLTAATRQKLKELKQ